VAKKANLNLMKKLIEENKKAPPSLLLQSWLLGLGGFLPVKQKAMSELDYNSYRYIYELETLWRLIDSKFSNPRLPKDFWAESMRPANSPARRIVAISHILARAKDLNLVAYFYSAFEDSEEILLEKGGFSKLNRRLKDKLMSPLEDFWGRYYKPGGAALNQPIRTLGENRAKVIIINILIPFFLLIARRRNDEKLEMLFWHFYQWYAKLPDNSMTRLMRYRLFGRGKKVKKIVSSSRRQLGLIQIFKDFCNLSFKNCNKCEFVKALEQGRDFL